MEVNEFRVWLAPSVPQPGTCATSILICALECSAVTSRSVSQHAPVNASPNTANALKNTVLATIKNAAATANVNAVNIKNVKNVNDDDNGLSGSFGLAMVPPAVVVKLYWTAKTVGP